MLKKDLKNKAGLNFVLCLFILIATILMSTGVVLMAGAFTNEERTYEMTKSPDMFCTLPTPMDESVYETIEERIKKIGNYEYFDRYEAYRLEGTSVRFGDGTSGFSTNEGRRDFLLQNMPEKLYDELLYEAIKATFDNRELAYNANLQLFNDDFCTDEVRLKRWEVFFKKIQWKESLLFADVMAVVTERLKGLFYRYWEEK